MDINSFVGIVIGWGLGLISSLIVYLYQKRQEKIDNIKIFLTIFESLKEDWDSFKEGDDLVRLSHRLSIFISNIEVSTSSAIKIQDKNATSFIFNSRKYALNFSKDVSAGNRGRFHYHRDDLNNLFANEYFKQLHEKYCNCNQELSAL